MNPRHYHNPPPSPARAQCPVCHEVTYSRGGIHPQCAVRQADPPRPKPKRPAAAAAPAAEGGSTE